MVMIFLWDLLSFLFHQDQLDLRNEAYNLRKFTAKFAHEKWVVFPAPMDGYVCKNALVETYMEGTPLNTLLINPPRGEVGRFNIVSVCSVN